MSKRGLVLTAVSLLVCLQLQGEAVNNYIKRRFNGEDVQVRDIQGLAERIQDGKLHLYLRDFIELVLKNSPDVQLSRLDAYTQANQITAAENPFDPVLTASFQSQRAITPFAFGEGFGGIGTSGGGGGTSTGGSGNGNGTGLGGIVALPQTISSLTQTSTLDYKQLLPWGQSFETTFQGIRSSGDEYISPAVFGSLTFSVVQPLLQNRTNLQARGPLTVARTQLLISTEQDQARIADTVAQAAVQYWDAVQDRENIRVQQQSVSLVEKSYQRDKMALDLGALAALDIYQSETQVAERNRDLVQAKHLYRTALDQLRHLIGADLTPELRATEIVLEDDPSQLPPRGSILPFEQALNSAMQVRPEFRAAGQRIEVDELNAHIARDALLPQLSLSANGGSSGPALNPLSTGGSVGLPATPYPGLGDTLKQVLSFEFPSYGFGLQLTFPLRNSTAKSQLANALVNRAQDRYRQRQTRQQIILDVRQAIDNIELANALIESAATARDLARKNVDAEQQKYQLGSITAFELLDSQNRLASTESALVTAFVTYQQAYVAYQRATWTLLDGFGMIVETPKVR